MPPLWVAHFYGSFLDVSAQVSVLCLKKIGVFFKILQILRNTDQNEASGRPFMICLPYVWHSYGISSTCPVFYGGIATWLSEKVESMLEKSPIRP